MQENKNLVVIYIVGFVTIIALALAAWAWQRGIVQFKNGSVQFSLDGAAMPSLDRVVNFPPEFTDEAKTIFNEKLAAAKEQLEKDPTSLEVWFDLAILYRMVGDHEGAVGIWKWVAANYPSDGISRHNLGEYYFHNEKDYPRAEKYYRESIEQIPTLSMNYTDLFDMYRYVYKQDTTAAVDVMKEGMTNISPREAIDFNVALALYFKEKGDKEEAITYMTAARDGVKLVGNAKLLYELDQQLAELKR